MYVDGCLARERAAKDLPPVGREACLRRLQTRANGASPGQVSATRDGGFVAAGPSGAVSTTRVPPESCPLSFEKLLQPPATIAIYTARTPGAANPRPRRLCRRARPGQRDG